MSLLKLMARTISPGHPQTSRNLPAFGPYGTSLPIRKNRKETAMADGLMAGKRGLIMGVANNRSIAWGIAKALAGQGAEIAFSYQGEALKKRVEPLAAEVGSNFLVECDVTNDAAMDETFRQLQSKWGKLDFLVHAIGFSDKNELDGRYIDTSAGNFALTMNISVYSF